VALDVTGSGKFTGDLTVAGNLTVEGTRTTVNTATMTVEDPNIELGTTETPTDTTANLGGITLKGASDKTIAWVQTTGNWTFNQNTDLTTGKEYRIENVQVLSKTRLGDTVTTAAGLSTIGTLGSLTVTGDVNLGSITANGALSITAGGLITIDSQRITGVLNPTIGADVANKAYVDLEIATAPVVFALDITGLSSPNAPGVGTGPSVDVRSILESLSPASAAREGTVARIHCTSYASATISGINISISTDSSGVLQKSNIAVDSNGTQNESVIADIVSANAASGAVALVPERYTMEFSVTSSSWAFISTTAYP
jgi:hypothetical protein